MDQLHQADQQITHHLPAGQIIQTKPGGGAVAEHARDRQRVIGDGGRHQQTPLAVSSANSASASARAAASATNPSAAPAVS